VTPPSVRFLGRKVYLFAVVVLVSAMRQGPSPRRVRELAQLFGADRRTIARWQLFWREHVPQTPFWKIARGRLSTTAATLLPRSLLEAFLGGGRSLPGLGPSPALSVADHDHARPAERVLLNGGPRPAEDARRIRAGRGLRWSGSLFSATFGEDCDDQYP